MTTVEFSDVLSCMDIVPTEVYFSFKIRAPKKERAKMGRKISVLNVIDVIYLVDLCRALQTQFAWGRCKIA